MQAFKKAAALLILLTASALLGTPGAATPSPLPVPSGTSVLSGNGSWETPIGTVGFNVSLTERTDGTLRGGGVSYLISDTGISWFSFTITDYMAIGEEILVLGTIIQTFNTPPAIPVGSQTALVVRDNQPQQDMAISASGLPGFLTIEDVAASLPPFRFDVTRGNYTVH